MERAGGTARDLPRAGRSSPLPSLPSPSPPPPRRALALRLTLSESHDEMTHIPRVADASSPVYHCPAPACSSSASGTDCGRKRLDKQENAFPHRARSPEVGRLRGRLTGQWRRHREGLRPLHLTLSPRAKPVCGAGSPQDPTPTAIIPGVPAFPRSEGACPQAPPPSSRLLLAG